MEINDDGQKTHTFSFSSCVIVFWGGFSLGNNSNHLTLTPSDLSCMYFLKSGIFDPYKFAYGTFNIQTYDLGVGEESIEVF